MSDSTTSATLAGPTLCLTDPVAIRQQLQDPLANGRFDVDSLMHRISTDEIFPSRYVLSDALDNIGLTALAGLRGDCVDEGALSRSPFSILVAGESFGCGSSREQAPLSLLRAGIRLIFARSVERIFLENCINLGGPLVSTDFGLLEQVANGYPVQVTDVLKDYDALSRDVVLAGGLLRYTSQLGASSLAAEIPTAQRAMTTAEKILAHHMSPTSGCVQPGDVGFADVDLRYTYEIFVPMIQALLDEATGGDWDVLDPDTLILFNDHLALLQDPAAERLRVATREFGKRRRLVLHDATPEGAAEGICHTILLEKYARPGQIIVGSDSHTGTSGAVGALAFGVGATEMANAVLTGKVRVKVPATIRVELSGRMPEGVMAKDVFLHLLSMPLIQEGRAIGRVLEFGGPGLRDWPLDEKAVLTNMAIEAGAFTGLIEPLVEEWRGDRQAAYEDAVEINLSEVVPMIAEPSDPRNSVPLDNHHADVAVDIGYIGSCTSGKLTDLMACASVLHGRKVHPKVRMFVQASSRTIADEAERLGLIDQISRAGATFLGPGCGACCGLGPGRSVFGEVTISSTNRNFPGRMGKGDVYLANPAVVAASAVAGKIVSPAALNDLLDTGA